MERITIDPNVCNGQPCVRGIRITVANVLGRLKNGQSARDIIAEFPELENADIPACRKYAEKQRFIKIETFRETLLSAYKTLRELDRDYPTTLSRFAAYAGRALFAWSKIDFDNWDNVARAVILMTGYSDDLSRALEPLSASNGEIAHVANLQRELQHSVISAMRLLTEIVDDYADYA